MRESRLLRRYSRKTKEQADEELSWGNDEVECRGEDLCMVKLEQMSELMHSSIGALTFNHPNKNPQCCGTGFLISQNLVLTCAHNLYDRMDRVYHSNFKFYPAAYGVLKDHYQIQSYYLPETYVEEKSQKLSETYDYALIKLKQSVKNKQFLTLVLGFEGISQALAIFGYPGKFYEILNKTATQRSIKQYGLELEKRISPQPQSKTLKRLAYEITTFPGQSGSPVILGSKDHNRVVAIHKGGNSALQLNYARAITLDLIIDLELWREQCNGSPFTCISNTNNFQISFQDAIFEDMKNMIKEERSLRKSGQAKSQQNIKEDAGLIEENKQLKMDLEMLSQQLANVKQFNSSILADYKEQQRQMQMERRNFDLIEKQNRLLQFQIDNLQKKPVKLAKSLSYQPEAPSSSSSIKIQSSNSFWDQNTPYANKFTISNKRVILKQYGIYQIVSAQPLSPESRTTFRVIRYGGDKDLCFGIITAKKRKEMYSGGLEDEESVGYWSQTKYKEGYIYVNGKKEVNWSASLFVREGQTLFMDLDKSSMAVTFINTTATKEFKLTENFRGKELFAFVCMKQKGDAVEIL